jgi:hypothetical protein
LDCPLEDVSNPKIVFFIRAESDVDFVLSSISLQLNLHFVIFSHVVKQDNKKNMLFWNGHEGCHLKSAEVQAAVRVLDCMVLLGSRGHRSI